MNHLNFKLPSIIGIALVCAGILACEVPGIAGKPTKPTVEIIAHGPNLVAVWREARRTGEGSQVSKPDDPLLIGFFDDGTFKAVFTGHRFEGKYELRENELVVTPTPMAAAPTQPPEATTRPPEAPTQSPEAPPASSLPVLAAGPILDDFEGGDFEARWWSDVGGGTTSFTCAPDQPGHDSAQAMRLTFEVGADGYAGCGIGIDPGQ